MIWSCGGYFPYFPLLHRTDTLSYTAPHQLQAGARRMPETKKITFENSRGMDVAGILTHPDGVSHDDPEQQYPAAILCHSFTGYKEIPHLAYLAKYLASQGIIAMRFDFTDCVGESDGTCEEMKLSNQVKDLTDAIDFLESRGEVDPNCIGLAGHSLGGMTSIIVAAKDERPQAVVPIAAPASHECEQLFQGDRIQEWKEQGYIYFDTHRRGEVKINWSFYEDLQQYDARDEVPEIDVPIRFVHGTEDDIVPLRNSEEMFEKANDPKDLHVIEGADHLFRKDEHQEAMVTAACDWLKEQL